MPRPLRVDWRPLSVSQRSARIKGIIARRKNNKISGKQLAEKYFRNISRGGVIVHCWRNGVRLPNARRRRPSTRGVRISARG